MNLLTDNWIPVRPLQLGASEKISLQSLLCNDKQWEIALPRDDMELATLQLLICIVQVLLIPKDKEDWVNRIRKPIKPELYEDAKKQFLNWFQIDHHEHPFMQVKGVNANKPTPMDKLMAGLDTSTNSCFVNAQGLAVGLCIGCVSIALYNLANGAPSFGGGFKYGIRGVCPVSTFIKGADLRTTIWLNVLTKESLDQFLPNWKKDRYQSPTWVEPIKADSSIPASSIDLFRGLFWQPSYTELLPAKRDGRCACCGHVTNKLFTSFHKAKFNYTIDGHWEHPHSPRVLSVQNEKNSDNDRGNTKKLVTKYLAFKQSVPAWTQLSQYIVKKELSDTENGNEGQKPALVIRQFETYLSSMSQSTELLVGCYRNNQASILERRHEVILINNGWEKHPDKVRQLVDHALSYRDILTKLLEQLSNGKLCRNIKVKGIGLTYKVGKKKHYVLKDKGTKSFYRLAETAVTNALASINFEVPAPTVIRLDEELSAICYDIFNNLTSPYVHDPELFRTVAIARRKLNYSISETKFQTKEETT